MRMRLQIGLAQSFLPNLFSFWNWTLCGKNTASSKLLLWTLFGTWKEPMASAVLDPRLANEDSHLIQSRDWKHGLLNGFLPALESVLSLSHSPFPSPMCSLFPSNSLSLFLIQNWLPLPSFLAEQILSFQCHFQHSEIEQATEKWCKREEITVLTSVAWPGTSKSFSYLNRLSQKTAAYQVSINTIILRLAKWYCRTIGPGYQGRKTRQLMAWCSVHFIYML